MNESLRPLGAEERSHESERQANVSDLIVAYFLRGIRSLDATPRGRALERRRVWSATPQVPSGRRHHPWD